MPKLDRFAIPTILLTGALALQCGSDSSTPPEQDGGAKSDASAGRGGSGGSGGSSNTGGATSGKGGASGSSPDAGGTGGTAGNGAGGSGGSTGGKGGTGGAGGSATGGTGGSNTGGSSSGGSGGVGGATGGSGGTGGAGTGGTAGTGTGGAGGSTVGDGGVVIDPTPGKWRTDRDPATGKFVFIDPSGKKAVLQGISLTGFETGTRKTLSGGGYWLFNSGQTPDTTNSPTIVDNVVSTVITKWKSDVVRVPICGSAWDQNYSVRDWGNTNIAAYKAWVNQAVKQARAAGKVVILDLHLWAIAKISKGGGPARGQFTSNGKTQNYSDFEDGCNGVNSVSNNGAMVDSCASQDWYTADPTQWECAIANADGATLHNAYYNKASISTMWQSVASQYKNDDAVWFELFNEPYTRLAPAAYPGVGENQKDEDYPWDLWTEVMSTWIGAIRDGAQAKNIIIVNGLDWGYDFGPKYGPIAYPDKYLPWKNKYGNIAYAFHPYQHGSCCGKIGASSDESASDPYQAGYCSYYADGTTWGAPSNAPLPVPGGLSCGKNGYAATQDKKMPPCHWVAAAYNPATKSNGLCAGDRTICNPLSQSACNAVDPYSPAAGGWSNYVLPMHQYGPLIATEFGTFDCSSPYVTTLLKYMTAQDISYTAWALWPQNSGGPGGLGACGYPSTMAPVTSGDFRTCLNATSCTSTISPLPWAGSAVFDDLAKH
ncbi:MAG: cellulase family glycosylhydrolase [Polyangiaceae bacterium]